MAIQLNLTVPDGHGDNIPNFLSSESMPEYIYGYGTPMLGKEIPRNWTKPLQLKVVEPRDGCHNVQPPPSFAEAIPSETRKFVGLVARGNCSFVDKAHSLESAGFAAMMLFEDDSDECVIMADKESKTEDGIGIYTTSITSTAAQLLIHMVDEVHANVLIRLRRPQLSDKIDPSAIILWVLAIGTLSLAGIWCICSMKHDQDAEHGPNMVSFGDMIIDSEDGGLVTAQAAWSFVFVASLALLLLYFFLSDALVVALSVLFSLAAVQAMGLIISTILWITLPLPWKEKVVKIPNILKNKFFSGDSLPVIVVVSNAISIAVGLTYFLFRDRHWVWVIQDILSMSFMILVLRTLHLPNIRVASILLISAMLYDVWWVFLQPLVTHSESVMVEVASRSSGGGFIMLPVALVVPQFHSLGTNPEYAILGMGDVVLPGLLCMLCARYDQSKIRKDRSKQFKLWRGYFVPSIISYSLGLIITYIALYMQIGGSEGQPALLWLVPSTLGTICALASWRGDFWDLWGNPYERLNADPYHDIENDRVSIENSSDGLVGTESLNQRLFNGKEDDESP